MLEINAIIRTRNTGTPWRMSAVHLDVQDGQTWVYRQGEVGSSWPLFGDNDPDYHEEIVVEW